MQILYSIVFELTSLQTKLNVEIQKAQKFELD